jgi:hypothetical protein
MSKKRDKGEYMIHVDPCYSPVLPLASFSNLDASEWLEAIGCEINPEAVPHLFRDEPGKRRRIFMQFRDCDSPEMILALDHAGFDMTTLREPRNTPFPEGRTPGTVSCLITGTSRTILHFLYRNPKVFRASIHLPEYSWLSLCPLQSRFAQEEATSLV